MDTYLLWSFSLSAAFVAVMFVLNLLGVVKIPETVSFKEPGGAAALMALLLVVTVVMLVFLPGYTFLIWKGLLALGVPTWLLIVAAVGVVVQVGHSARNKAKSQNFLKVNILTTLCSFTVAWEGLRALGIA